jgi:dCMP deaminase
MKQKFISAFMKTAETFAELSSAVRLKVGAIVVKEERIISIGYNGTPSGWDNTCEYQEIDMNGNDRLVTKKEVIHAESNAITKLAKSPESGNNSVMFVTHAPCIECAKLIYQSGISSVYYRNSYRDSSGIDFLNKCGVFVVKV